MRSGIVTWLLLSGALLYACNAVTDLDDLGPGATSTSATTSTTGTASAGGGAGQGGTGAGGCARTDDDPLNCGVCGHDCLGATCSNGVCAPEILAEEQDTPTCIALDVGYVYWGLSSNTGYVRFVLKEGGPIQDYGANIDAVADCTVDGGYVYAMDGDAVWRYAIPPGEYTTLLYGEIGLRGFAKAPGSPTVFATNALDGTVLSCASECNEMPNLVASGQATPYQIAADETHAYWTNRGDGTIADHDRMNLMTTTLASGQSGPGGIALDDTHVYWANQGGSIMRVEKTGGTPMELASGLQVPESVAVDNTHVYWTDPGAGTISKVAKNGGAPVVLAKNQGNPWDLAVDDTHVYWITQVEELGTVQRVAK
jgi:hypothetical protein